MKFDSKVLNLIQISGNYLLAYSILFITQRYLLELVFKTGILQLIVNIIPLVTSYIIIKKTLIIKPKY